MVLGEEQGNCFLTCLRQRLNIQAVIHFGVSLSLAGTTRTKSQASQTPECPGRALCARGWTCREGSWASGSLGPCTHWGVCIW